MGKQVVVFESDLTCLKITDRYDRSIKKYNRGNNEVSLVYVLIYKTTDEWFYVQLGYQKIFLNPMIRSSHYREFYKCDQFDGLLEFLNDMKW